MHRRIIYILILFCILAGSPASGADGPKRLAVVPFKINAEKDLSFLRDGIVDMLTSRLSLEDKVQVIGREQTERAFESVSGTLNDSRARSIGAKLGVDYVLFGSLTVFGESVSIDAKMVDVAGTRPPLTFFNQSQGMSSVIPDINAFATDINSKVFGRGPVVARTAPVQTQTQAQVPPQQDIHAHPEKMLESGFDEQAQPAAGSPFVSQPQSREVSAKFWKSKNFPAVINGLALGDVYGDGKIETVVALGNEVNVIRTANNRIYETQKVAESGKNNILAVDVADINGNGYAEIFVTALNVQRRGPKSFVLEYNGQKMARITDDSSWYYRVTQLGERGDVLLSQKQGSGGVYSGRIYEMAWQHPGYGTQQQIRTSGKTNLMGFTVGDIREKGLATAVAFSDTDHLRLIDPSGVEIWKGSERLGGSPHYSLIPMTEHGNVPLRRYLPMRLRVRDLDGDGIQEVIVVKNYEMSGNMLDQFRKFTDAHIETLSWDGIGLASKWKTRKISGYIGDFDIGDFDNDGRDELVAGVILKTGSMVFTSAKSTIIAYELVE
jgi:TolB-like protein